ncbi:hypothetical protein [Pseudomonas viridiflava]|uniref:hypothetical protein n=2 Tax=Pseudomonas viridiflava TaxID=33069 RepID=UPI000F014FD6|nr:hypothetical protein [Pseudomonas viridiflava]
MTHNQLHQPTQAQQIAGVILDQLGARRFMMMTGARAVVALPHGLQFQLPARTAAHGVNMVRVELDGSDLYCVIAGRWQSLEFTERAREYGVSCDELQNAFTRLTGIHTHL